MTDEENEAQLGDIISQFNASDDELHLGPAIPCNLGSESCPEGTAQVDLWSWEPEGRGSQRPPSRGWHCRNAGRCGGERVSRKESLEKELKEGLSWRLLCHLLSVYMTTALFPVCERRRNPD